MLRWCEHWVNQGDKLLGRVAFRIQASTIKLLQESSRQFHWVDYICRKRPTADVQLYSKCSPVWGCCRCGVWVDWGCLEIVIAGRCTGKSFRLGQTVGGLTCGGVEISLVVIRLGEAGLGGAGFVCLLGLLGGGEVWCDLVCRCVFG